MTEQDPELRGADDLWRPDATAAAPSGSATPDTEYVDPVIVPIPPPFNRSGWPPSY
jgi:hypothetical protein